MGALAAFALGVLIGLVFYWLVYRLYWLRWSGHMQRDMSYLQAKVDSAEFTSFGLERQVAAQKSELTGQRSKISELERENRLAQARLEEVNADKQALSTHLETLRAELTAYKKVMMEPALPALSQTPPNGKTQDPPRKLLPPERAPAAGLSNSLLGMNKEASKNTPTKTQPNLPASLPIKTPSNGNGNGRLHLPLPEEQILEPVLVIARPRVGGDYLEIIQGVGPAIARKLRQAGIDTFQALSVLTPQRLKEVVGPRTAKLMDAESVIKQAKKLVGERRSRSASV